MTKNSSSDASSKKHDSDDKTEVKPELSEEWFDKATAYHGDKKLERK